MITSSGNITKFYIIADFRNLFMLIIFLLLDIHINSNVSYNLIYLLRDLCSKFVG